MSSMSRNLIYDNRFWRVVLKGITGTFLKLSGWRVVGDVPVQKKLVLLGAPHTSNWDFPIFLSVVGWLGLRVNYLGKHALFEGPFAWIFYYLGGVPVDRSGPGAGDIVKEVTAQIKARDQIWLGVAPEGTRTKVKKWKTGFHRIALSADVPVALVYLDAKSKTVGFGPVFHMTDDLDADMAKIQAFYADKTGVNPENA